MTIPKMAYKAGVKPWHGSGVELEPGAGAVDSLAAAGLDFEVGLAPIYYGSEGNPTEFSTDERRVLYRTDTGAIFDCPGSGYHPVQTREVAEIFDAFVKAGDMGICTMGSFQGGKIPWFLADMKVDAELKTGAGRKKHPSGDKMLGRLFFGSPFVYGQAGFMRTTEICVVCENTYQAAKRDGDLLFRLIHNAPFDNARKARAKEIMATERERFAALVVEAEILAGVALTLADARSLAVQLVGKTDRAFADQPRVVGRVVDLFDGQGMGSSLPTRDGTAWGLFNAITQYSDWEYGKSDQGKRLERAWLGSGDILKRRSRAKLLAFARGEVDLSELQEAEDAGEITTAA